MKFDYCIGNPPYMNTRETTKDIPIYNDFMDAAYTISDKVELITPAKFLFNSGATPKQWNQERLDDTHFKILKYVEDSSQVFSNTTIAGGVAISYRDASAEYGAIGVFLPYSEMNSIRKKIIDSKGFVGIDSIMFPYSAYTISEQFWIDFPRRKEQVEYIVAHRNELSKEEKKGKLSNFRIITSNIFELISDVFYDAVPDDEEYCCLIGRQDNQRCNKYILKKYIDVADNYNKYKVLISIADGAAGQIGKPIPARISGVPIVVNPGMGYTQSFQSIGCVDKYEYALNIANYVKTKFARAALGILKITQHYPVEKWKYVPLQDFTERSDIDWSKSIHEIDLQLYKKYKLTKEEIDFVEKFIKEMT